MKLKSLIAGLIAFSPLFYLGFVWKKLPVFVALHYDSNMNPDRYGSKSELVMMISFLALTSIGLSLLFQFLPKIDPKKNLEKQKGILRNIAFGTSTFLAMIGIFVVESSLTGGQTKMMDYLPALILLFMAFLGNYMLNLKPNYFAGIRTPWTLESENVWRKTHLFGGRLIFYGSLLGIIVTFFLPDLIFKLSFVTTLIFIIFGVPVWYSYKVYKEENPTRLQ
jgi:uncharacterized membrane protein